MRIRNISHERWPMFFDDFTHLYEGAHVNVETMGDGAIGVRSQLRDMPLVGIVPAATEAGDEEWIEIIAGETRESHVSHSVAVPAAVRVAEEEDGRAIALQIESQDGIVTIIRFEPPRENLPEGFRIE